jgi:phytol kinase
MSSDAKHYTVEYVRFRIGKVLGVLALDFGLNAPVSLLAQIGVVLLWLIIVGLIAEVARRWGNADSEITRKIVHIGMGNVIVLAWGLDVPAWLGIAASVVFSAIALLSYRIPILPTINGVGRKSLGTFFYAVSIGVLIALFWESAPQIAALGVLVMTWGDGLAALIGQRWGTHRYTIGGIEKSWEGSLAMAVASFGVSLLMLHLGGMSLGQASLIAIAIAVGATALEAFSRWGIDNLTVPLGSAAIALWLSSWLVV